MDHLLQVRSPAEQERFCALPGLSSLNRDVLARQAPDALWMLTDAAGEVVARCSVWWKQRPAHAEDRLGLIGHYAAQGTGPAGRLLQHACVELAAHGCTLAVGPMDGNTWQRYRLLTERGPEPIFFLEPDNPDDWPAHFTDHGFTKLADYYSSLIASLEPPGPRLTETEARLRTRGIHLRTLNLERFEDELRAIHGLALASFANNFLYSPIGEEEFVEQYRGIRPHVRPELVLIAELEGRPIGFLFAIPDLLQGRGGRPITTVILKTLAVHPEHTGGGLGGLLTARCHEAARQLGYTRAIHALMHEANHSRKIGRQLAQTIRRYTLFARALGPPS